MTQHVVKMTSAAVDVAEVIINQLVGKDHDRESPTLYLFKCKNSLFGQGTIAVAQLRFGVKNGVTSYITPLGANYIRTPCPEMAAKVFTGHALIDEELRSNTHRNYAVVLDTGITCTKTKEGCSVVASEVDFDGSLVDAINRLSRELASMLPDLARIEVE